MQSVCDMLDDSDLKESVTDTVVVFGATSIIGQHLLSALVLENYKVVAVSRQAHSDDQDGVFWHQSREEDDFEFLPANSKLIHLAPLWILPDNLEKFAQRGVKRIVTFSSTTRFSKKESSIEAEREIAGRLELAEEQLTSRCKQLNIDLTILRPTLVFELGKDKNVSTIVNFVKRFGFFVVIGKASGLRQPVLAQDLALASVIALNNPSTYDKTYNLVGSPTLSYRDMVRQVFRALGKKARIVSVPLSLIEIALPIVKLIPRYKYLNLEMFKRMNQDLVFDSKDAENDFGYETQKFAEALSQALAEE